MELPDGTTGEVEGAIAFQHATASIKCSQIMPFLEISSL